MKWNLIFGLISVLNIASVIQCRAEEEILCERHPTAYIVGERAAKTKKCEDAAAKIQAIAYECGDPADTYSFIQDSLEKNVEKAKDKCDDYCKSVNSDCKGRLDVPTACGLKTPENRTVQVGREIIHCPKSCKGQAFNYCSIYHGNFFGTDRALFKGVSENCHCESSN